MSKEAKRELLRQKELSSVVQKDGDVVIKELQYAILNYLLFLKKGNERFIERLVKSSRISPAVNDTLVESTERLLLLSFLLGVRHGLEDKPVRARKGIVLADYSWSDGVAFDDAVKFLKSKVPVTKQEWNKLEPLLRFRAFTVARLGQLDMIEVVRRKIVKAVSDGKSQKSFISDLEKEQLGRIADTRKGDIAYWNTVYRTNVNTAYNAGRMMANEKVPRPLFYKFSANVDERVTHICRERNGIVRSSRDPFWNSNTPSLHFNCRSTLIPIYTQSKETAVRSVAPAQRGFGGNPYSRGSFWQLSPAMVKRANTYGMGSDIVKVALQLGMNNYALGLLQGMKEVHRGTEGGFVREATNREAKSKQQKAVRKVERGIAQRLADEGHKVFLLPESKLPKVKNPDAIVDGRVFEFKRFVSNNVKRIANKIREASKQAENVVIEIDGSVKLHDLRSHLRGEKVAYLKILWVMGDSIHKWDY